MNRDQNELLQKELQAGPSSLQWEKVGVRQHHGISFPLFSLHSHESAGIGEYPDLLPMLRWCASLGLDTLQLLPLNDTGPNRSPYSAISAYALNPLHLGLSQLPGLKEDFRLASMVKELQALTKLPRVDYLTLHAMRDRLLQEYFTAFSGAIISSDTYKKFTAKHRWLTGYALFKSLKSHCHWQSWCAWPEEIKHRVPTKIAELTAKFETDILFHSFIQYLCFQQMEQVKKEADALGIYLKGDLPILLDRESADIWLHTPLFDLDFAAGAPPDMYSKTGQYWGFPLYRWEEMAKDDYAWWQERLSVASNFYHIYRIDHVVGFFRIWAIEQGKPATEGHFVPAESEAALTQGAALMEMMLSSSPMLPIGEDLGSVPDGVRHELQQLGICGTKVMRWERDWNSSKEFIRPEDYIPLSVTTVSTHDSSPLQLWWTQDVQEARDYCTSQGWEYAIPLSPEYHFSLLYSSHHTGSLFHINLLTEYLALFPELVHAAPEQERINTPGVISDANWSYRFVPSVETITTHPELAQLILDVKA